MTDLIEKVILKNCAVDPLNWFYRAATMTLKDYSFNKKFNNNFSFLLIIKCVFFFTVPPILPIDLPILKDQAMTKSSIEYIHTICLE